MINLRSSLILLSLCAALAAPYPALANAESCLDLFKECEAQKKISGNNYQTTTFKDGLLGSHCLGYFAGFSDAMAAVDGIPFCLADNSTVEQETLAYVAWAEHHPERLNDSASVCTVAALSETFPCPEKPAPKTKHK